MGLLSNKTAEEELAEELIETNKDNLKPLLGMFGNNELKDVLVDIGQRQGIEAMHSYMQYTLNRINYITNKQAEYSLEAKLADKVYKAYVTDGLSRLEKINGRFMASQTIKLDMLIEQNNHIIQLLEQTVSLLNQNGSSQNTNNYSTNTRELQSERNNHSNEIFKWQKLRDQGIITSDEFEEKKRQILNYK